MQIIRNGCVSERHYKMTCPLCGCIALYDESEIQSDKDGAYITCPTCKKIISHGKSDIVFIKNPL